MFSSCQNPLPLEKYTNNRVIVYFYRGRWVPIMFYELSEAIKLCHRAMSEGYEILVFPPDFDPRNLQKEPPISSQKNSSENLNDPLNKRMLTIPNYASQALARSVERVEHWLRLIEKCDEAPSSRDYLHTLLNLFTAECKTAKSMLKSVKPDEL